MFTTWLTASLSEASRKRPAHAFVKSEEEWKSLTSIVHSFASQSIKVESGIIIRGKCYFDIKATLYSVVQITLIFYVQLPFFAMSSLVTSIHFCSTLIAFLPFNTGDPYLSISFDIGGICKFLLT